MVRPCKAIGKEEPDQNLTMGVIRFEAADGVFRVFRSARGSVFAVAAFVEVPSKYLPDGSPSGERSREECPRSAQLPMLAFVTA